MNKVCQGCLSRESEIQFLRSMVHTYANNQAILMSETLIPKMQPDIVQALYPTAVNDNGKVVRMDQPDKPAPELESVDPIDVVNEIMGH